MSRWKELPAGITGSERQLLVQLRRMKDHSGLSLATLASRTSYSASSWERYLNGKKPVPREAVEELAQVCGTGPTRLIVLYEVAERARARTPAQSDRPPSSTEPATPAENPQPAPPQQEQGQGQEQQRQKQAREPGRTQESESESARSQEARPEGQAQPRSQPQSQPGAQDRERASRQEQGSRGPARTVPLGRMLVAVVLAVAVAFGAGLLTARAWRGDAPAEKTGAAAAGTGYLRGQSYTCAVRRQDGELRAGHSDTREMLLDINSTGFDVVEAQCLLHEKGFDPGASDGLYSERTKEAAKKFQDEHHLVVDGIIGPDTWKELRR